VSFVILNLFIGIVLEAFETSDEGDILRPKDLDDFTSKWSQFDPSATWYIKAQDMDMEQMEQVQRMISYLSNIALTNV